MMKIHTPETELTESDARYGYPFGVDGFLSTSAAAEFLACSTKTVDRLCEDGVLRRGPLKPLGHIRICKRSFANYVKSIEKA